MNGYDFELDFSGTTEDYADLVSDFQKKGVSSIDIYLFHKNELESWSIKQVCMDELLEWRKITQTKDYHKVENAVWNVEIWISGEI